MNPEAIATLQAEVEHYRLESLVYLELSRDVLHQAAQRIEDDLERFSDLPADRLHSNLQLLEDGVEKQAHLALRCLSRTRELAGTAAALARLIEGEER